MIAKQFLSLYDFYVSFLLCYLPAEFTKHKIKKTHKNEILCKTPHMVIYGERVGNYSSNSILLLSRKCKFYVCNKKKMLAC